MDHVRQRRSKLRMSRARRLRRRRKAVGRRRRSRWKLIQAFRCTPLARSQAVRSSLAQGALDRRQVCWRDGARRIVELTNQAASASNLQRPTLTPRSRTQISYPGLRQTAPATARTGAFLGTPLGSPHPKQCTRSFYPRADYPLDSRRRARHFLAMSFGPSLRQIEIGGINLPGGFVFEADYVTFDVLCDFHQLP
jgi:hypothetical protein